MAKMYILSSKGIELFETQNDLFKKFYETFPFKTPDGRVLRTDKVNTNSAKKTKLIWNRVTSKNSKIQNSVINGLQNEIIHKTKTNSLKYMPGIDTWLRSSSWEKYQVVESNVGFSSMERDL